MSSGKKRRLWKHVKKNAMNILWHRKRYFPIVYFITQGCRTGNDARRSNKFRFQRVGIISRTGHGGERLLVSAQSRTS